MKEKIKSIFQDKEKRNKVIGAAVIGLAVLVLLVFVVNKLGQGGDFSDLKNSAKTLKTTHTQATTQAEKEKPIFVMPSLDINEMEYILPKWNSEMRYDSYGDLVYGYNAYNPVGEIKNQNTLDGLLGESTAVGYNDGKKNESKIIPCKIYKISGISADSAVAVKLNGEPGTHLYANYLYSSMTLKNMKEDFSLESEMKINGIYYKNPQGEEKIYTPDKNGDIIEKLFSNEEITNNLEATYSMTPTVIISISLPALGIDNVALALTEDGYLQANILQTASSFEIGQPAVSDFIKYLEEDCQSQPYVK